MLRSLTRPAVVAAAAVLTATTALTALTLTPPFSRAAAAVPVPDTASAAQTDARRAFAQMPLSFEANRGQVDARSEFLARGEGFTLFLTQKGAVFDLEAPARSRKAQRTARRVAVALDPVGANPAPRVVGGHRRAGTTSYFLGNDPSHWQRDVPTFDRVRYRDLYPGIDMVFHGARSGAEYDFVVAPGSDPARIGYRLRGTDGIRIEHGDLVATTAVGDFVHRAPVAYQRIDGERRTVPAAFRIAHGVISFDLGAYDPGRPLVIDPETDLEYATYLGGSGFEIGHAIALDGGDAYVTGTSGSTDFPTTTGPYGAATGSNVYVARISPDGAGAADLVSAAVLGGAGTDSGMSIAVDGGDTFVTGIVRASPFPATSDFPTTPGAFDESFNGVEDAFLARFSLESTGSADLTYATFLGGSGFDDARSVVVHGGDVYLAGSAESPDYPTTAGAFDRTLAGVTDATFTRLSPDGAGAADLVYSTYFGGGGIDSAWALAMDAGDAYLTGSTWDVSDFPTTPGALDRTLGGEKDAFVTRISPDGAEAADLVYSTYLGGPSWDDANGITVAGGDAYVVGTARSARFPTTAGAYDRTYNGDTDGFVSRVSPDSAGSKDLRYSTFLGGGQEDWVDSIVVKNGALYICGGSESANFPTTVSAYDRTYGGGVDGTVARIVPRAKGKADLKYSTFLGGNGWDTLYQLVMDGGTAYVAGWTDSDDLPTTAGAFDTVGNSDDGFLAALRVPDSRFRPDGWIRRAVGGWVGDDIYNTTGEGQTRRSIMRAGWRRVHFVTAQNDDDATDRLRLTGPGSSADWKVRYFRGAEDITRQVTGRGFRTALLPPGGLVEIKVRVTARDSAQVGTRKVVRVEVNSLGNPAFTDVVKARFTITD